MNKNKNSIVPHKKFFKTVKRFLKLWFETAYWRRTCSKVDASSYLHELSYEINGCDVDLLFKENTNNNLLYYFVEQNQLHNTLYDNLTIRLTFQYYPESVGKSSKQTICSEMTLKMRSDKNKPEIVTAKVVTLNGQANKHTGCKF